MEIGWIAHRLPTHWLQIIPTVDLQQTLYRGIIQQGWSVKAIYSHLKDNNNTEPPMVMVKWDRELSAVGGQEWSQACKHVHTIHDTKLRAFHLLFINQGYALNHHVSHFLNVGPQCRLCGQERETYIHLFWNCVFVQLIIDTVREVGINYLDQEEEWLTQKSFLLGTSPTLLPKTVALLGKRFIFLATIHSQTPHLFPTPPWLYSPSEKIHLP